MHEPHWCDLDDLPEPWRSGFATGAVVKAVSSGGAPVTFLPWKIALRSRMFWGLGFGGLLSYFVIGFVRYARQNPGAWEQLTGHLPLTLLLSAACLALAAKVYFDLLGLDWALTEQRLRQRGLHRYGVALDADLLVARTPDPRHQGRRCLVVPRSALAQVELFSTTRNPQEPGERFFRMHCRTHDGEHRTVHLPASLELRADQAVRDLDGWARGRDLPASPPEGDEAGPSRSPHRLPLLWLGLLTACCAVAWLLPL